MIRVISPKSSRLDPWEYKRELYEKCNAHPESHGVSQRTSRPPAILRALLNLLFREGSPGRSKGRRGIWPHSRIHSPSMGQAVVLRARDTASVQWKTLTEPTVPQPVALPSLHLRPNKHASRAQVSALKRPGFSQRARLFPNRRSTQQSGAEP